MSKKVFCQNCNWFREENQECYHESNIKYTQNWRYSNIETLLDQPCNINANNNCKNHISILDKCYNCMFYDCDSSDKPFCENENHEILNWLEDRCYDYQTQFAKEK